MANVIQQSIFEFQSTITISGLGGSFPSLYATDDINQYLEVINATTDPLYTTYPITVKWAASDGSLGEIHRDDTATPTAPYFEVTYTTATAPILSDKLQIQIVSEDITNDDTDVTVTITFYAKVKGATPTDVAAAAAALLASTPLENTMNYYTEDPGTPGVTPVPAEMASEDLSAFDIRILGTPVSITQAPNQNFRAIYVFSGFDDQTSIDNALEYNLVINDLPEINLSALATDGAKVTTDTVDGTEVTTATIDPNTATGDVLVNIPYSDVKGKTVFVVIPATSTSQITASTTANPLYIPVEIQLNDTTMPSTLPTIDTSNSNVQVNLIAPTNKSLTGATKILIP